MPDRARGGVSLSGPEFFPGPEISGATRLVIPNPCPRLAEPRGTPGEVPNLQVRNPCPTRSRGQPDNRMAASGLTARAVSAKVEESGLTARAVSAKVEDMIRVLATFCFWLTLFCPAYCLAEADGVCPDHDRSEARNCEAMAIGAIVEELQVVAVPLARLAPPHIGLVRPAKLPTPGSDWWLPLMARNRANTKPPPGSTRQALLQTFLF